MSNFQERLSMLFKSERLSLATANTKIGISKTQLGKYLSGYYIPSLKNAIKLASYFNCSIDYLVGKDDVKNKYIISNEPNFDKFLNRYKSLLIENNLNHYKITKQLGINRNNLDYWKKHKVLPSLDILTSLATTLQSSIEFLIGRTDYRENI